MLGWHWLVVALSLAGLVAVAWIGLFVWLRRHIRRAKEQFHAHRAELAVQFLEAAGATGKPRGLRWVACDWADEIAFARDRHTGQLAALVAVLIRFEAIEGGDMEGVAAVGNVRNASAVFFYKGGFWRTAGRAIFNLDPGEALEQMKDQYARLSSA
jgi:hypothetical protein